MKLGTLLEAAIDAIDSEHLQTLRKLALKMQTLLADLDHIDLDVQLKTEKPNEITVSYHDENNLVRGNVILRVNVMGMASGAPVVRYSAWTLDGGTIGNNIDNAGAIHSTVFRLFQQDIPFKAFEQSVMTALGTSNVSSIDKNLIPKDEVYGAKVTPPFLINKRGAKTVMLHNSRIVQALDICITSASTVKAYIRDTNGDLHVFEGTSLDVVNDQLHQFITAALEAA